MNDASCNQCVQLFDLDHFVGNRILSKTRGSAAALTVLLLHKVVSLSLSEFSMAFTAAVIHING